MSINKAGLDLIKEFEGCELAAYKDSAGVLTIGWGHTTAAGPPAVRAGMKISQADADRILATDMLKFETAVDAMLTRTSTANQFAALVSFCYNEGAGALKSSTLLRRFNSGNETAAADEFRKWDKARDTKTRKLVVLPGLVRRREAERRLFLTPDPAKVNPPAVPKTINDLAKDGSRIAKGAQAIKKIAGTVTAGGVVTGTAKATGFLGAFGAAIAPVRDFASDYGLPLAIGATAMIGGLLYWQAHRIGEARAEDANSGKTIGAGPHPA